MFVKYASTINIINKKNVFNLTLAAEKVVRIGRLVTEIQNIVENVCSISYSINL